MQPIVKWAGGKSRLVPEILRRLPTQIDTYYEPFIGGGAVFFAMAAERRFKRAVLSDLNTDLIDLYRAIKSQVEDVIEVLQGYRHSETFYYELRSKSPKGLAEAERAARFIYLNKTCFNGLYRVNKSGQFNVPFGRYKNPNFCDPDALRAASRAFDRVTIVMEDFEDAISSARSGDAVYFDPPYVPLSKTSNFTAYTRQVFGLDEHQRLADVFADLASQDVAMVLSNSDTSETRRMYSAWQVHQIKVRRSINSDATKRGAVNEILVQRV